MAETDTCKQTLDFSIPAEVVDEETERVVLKIQKKVRLPGFRPGKAPLSIIRSRFASDIRQEVLESILPKQFHERVERENLRVVGTPNITDVHLHAGEPLRFKAEFEVAPDFELGEYVGLSVPYREPQVTEEEVTRRVEALREQKAEYVNLDPRPLEDGDYAVVTLDSISGVEGQPIHQEELVLHVGGEDTMTAFTESLRGRGPGDEMELEVSYPPEYGERRLAGKTVRFRLQLHGLRRKELPEINDEFARDVGDYQSLDELRAEMRRQALRDDEQLSQAEAKNRLVDMLVDAHGFAVPEAYVERQVEANVESRMRELVAYGVDPRSIQLDWQKVREAQAGRARREVKASLLLERIAGREAIETLQDEVDREVHRLARQLREPAASLRSRLEEDGSLRRIAVRIRTDKTLNFLFEKARKVPPEAAAEPPAELDPPPAELDPKDVD